MSSSTREGLNLSQAVQSAKPFRRSGDRYWLSLTDGCFRYTDEGGVICNADINEEWFLVSDWETLEPTIELTEEEFWYAYGRACRGLQQSEIAVTEMIMRNMAKELGFPEGVK